MEKARMLGTEQAVVGGTEGGRSPTGVPPTTAAAADPRVGLSETPAALGAKPIPDPAVPERPVRRRFAAEYKLRILREADVCTEPGQLGALLRREGLYSSHLRAWRHGRDEGTLAGLTPKRRGRKPNPDAPLIAENERLKRENQRLAAKLRQAETIIEVQKKLSEILGIPLPPPEGNGSVP
jgi:transposase